jgi:hypothetical protein
MSTWFAAHPRYAAEVDRQRAYFEHHCRAASIANATDISAANTSSSAGRAGMLIATADNPQKPVVSLGSTTWSVIPPAPGQPATVAVKAEADIPDLKMRAIMTLRKNTDPTLQATHTIDLKFSFADGAPITGFKDVGLPQMRKEDSTAAEVLTSVKVKISDTYFLIALAKGDADTARNLDLMRTASLVRLPAAAQRRSHRQGRVPEVARGPGDARQGVRGLETGGVGTAGFCRQGDGAACFHRQAAGTAGFCRNISGAVH